MQVDKNLPGMQGTEVRYLHHQATARSEAGVVGTAVEAQWLRLRASNTGGTSLISGRETIQFSHSVVYDSL